ncbi:MAG: SRPBCC family protein [Hyphomicrobiales bacterium]
MKRRIPSTLALLLALAALAPAAARAAWSEIPVVRITQSVDVAAPPAAIWSYLTTGKNLVTWCPIWKNPSNAKVNLTKVGDVLDFTDEWGNGGRSIVTYVAVNRELRVAHEPTNGSYMCEARLRLEPKGTVTHVVYTEQYTDESKPEDRKATASKMESEMATTMAAVKKAVEKK